MQHMNMELSERQENILEKLVEQYIAVAQPISSQVLEEQCSFGLSPATIRNELALLAHQGFLEQLHASSGRVPTDRGYRFLVDKFLDLQDTAFSFTETKEDEDGRENFEFLQDLARKLSLHSSMLSVISWNSFFWKEGWEQLFLQPEFEETKELLNFAHFVSDFEKSIAGFSVGDTLKVLIGKENQFSNMKNFSIIVTECEGRRGRFTVALLGPKRTAYKNNIGLLKSLTNWNGGRTKEN